MTEKVYVLDTSVLLSVGTRALYAFKEAEVVIPMVVIRELEKKRTDPLTGFIAREVLNFVESLISDYGHAVSTGVSIGEDSTLRVETNHIDVSTLPSGMQGYDNDTKILAVAYNLAKGDKNRTVTLVTNDVPLRITAQISLDLNAEEFRLPELNQGDFTGIYNVSADTSFIDNLYKNGVGNKSELIFEEEVPDSVNVAVIIHALGAQKSALGIVSGNRVTLVRTPQVQQKHGLLTPRSAEQRFALSYLEDEDVSVVSLGGKAGTGKTLLSLAAGISQVFDKNYRKVVVFRPLLAVGNQTLGFLPGTEEEKMTPWASAIYDAMDSLGSPEIMAEVNSESLVEVLPITHVRGRTLSNTFIIIDEAQNLERNVLLTIISRMGEGSKMVLCWDAAQKDNSYISRNDGIVALVNRFKGEDIFAHVTFSKSERSRVAEIAANILEEMSI